MSGRIETVNHHKEESDYKYSKNETFGIRESGVDIGEDLKSGVSRSVGKVTIKPAALKRTALAITGVVDPEPEQEEETNE